MVSHPGASGGAIAQVKQILLGNIFGELIPAVRMHRPHRHSLSVFFIIWKKHSWLQDYHDLGALP
jgi:hypothetical protein